MINSIGSTISRNRGRIAIGGMGLLIAVIAGGAGDVESLVEAALKVRVLESEKPITYEDLRTRPAVEGQISPIDPNRARLK